MKSTLFCCAHKFDESLDTSFIYGSINIFDVFFTTKAILGSLFMAYTERNRLNFKLLLFRAFFIGLNESNSY